MQGKLSKAQLEFRVGISPTKRVKGAGRGKKESDILNIQEC